MEQMRNPKIELSIIIKTLNEEKNIARCIDAILTNLHGIKFEIIVADSGSSDNTVDIAASYPVSIVQLADPAERSCGIGPQLGYQHSLGRYILLLDADMVIHGEFVRVALARMKKDVHCAGVGGQLIECSGTGYEYEISRTLMSSVDEREVSWLDGVGIYRREAIENVGYLSNRNLHAYEEKELGLRLRHAGWKLFRLGDVAVDHYGHTLGTFSLLARRWKSGYADACGESIRACLGKPYLVEMILVHKMQISSLLFLIIFIASVIVLPWFWLPLVIITIFGLVALVSLVIRKRGMRAAAYSLLYTNLFALGLARGLFKRQSNPASQINSIVLKQTAMQLL